MGVVFYHYTTTAGAKGIMKSQKIWKSEVQDNIDAVFGEGVYLTKLSPEQGGARKIYINNYDGTGEPSKEDLERVEKVIKLTFPSGHKMPVKQAAGGRDVWLYKGSDLDISTLNPVVIDVVGDPLPSDKEVKAIYQQLIPILGGAMVGAAMPSTVLLTGFGLAVLSGLKVK